MSKLMKFVVATGAGFLVIGLASTYAMTRPFSKVVETARFDVARATESDLELVSGMRIFFAHQSVGANILGALPGVFAQSQLEAPIIVESVDASSTDQSAIIHTYIGRNGDPIGKIEEFDKLLRNELADTVDVAMLKLCYVDILEGADVEAIFAAYRDTMAALERDYPGVVFIYSTIPLTAEPDGAVQNAKRRVKSMIGRVNHYIPEHNIARMEFNELIRAEYESTGRLFDIAAIQATDFEGEREVREFDGERYYAMEDALSSDPGHLNPEGANVVASSLLAVIANASTEN